MTNQPELFEPSKPLKSWQRSGHIPSPKGDALRDEAMERVESTKAAERWREEALAPFKAVCQRKPEVTTDDLWEMVYSPPEPRAAGPFMRHVANLGWIEPTDRVQKSRRPQRHSGRVGVWRSCLYQPPTEHGKGG